jgi:hypothetical protein
MDVALEKVYKRPNEPSSPSTAAAVACVRAPMTFSTAAAVPVTQQPRWCSLEVLVSVPGLHTHFLPWLPAVGYTDRSLSATWEFITSIASSRILPTAVVSTQKATVVPTIRGNSRARLVIEEIYDNVELSQVNASTAVARTAAVASGPSKVVATTSYRASAVRETAAYMKQNAGQLFLNRLWHALAMNVWELALHMPTLSGIRRHSTGASVPAKMCMQIAHEPAVRTAHRSQHAHAPMRLATQVTVGIDEEELPWEFVDVVDWSAQELPFFYSLAAIDWSEDGVGWAQHAHVPPHAAAQLIEGMDENRRPWELGNVVDWGAQGLPFLYCLYEPTFLC